MKLLLVPALCLVFAACNTTPNKMGRATVATDQTEDQTDPADWKLTLKVKEAIMADNSIATSNSFVSVMTNDGVVTLTGSVSSQAQIDKIVKAAKSVDGVKSVDNQLVVSP